MDYDINLDSLESKKTELEQLKSTINEIHNNLTTGYLSKLSGTEISSLISKIKTSSERLKNGYNNSTTWFNNYLKELKELEDNLANFNVNGIDKPKPFTEEFIDIFSKKTIPALKTNGDPNMNSNLGPTIVGEGLIEYKFNNGDFYIVDTKIPVEEYAKYVADNKLYQNAGLLGGQCMLLSQYYASDMLSGKYTSKSTMEGHGGAPAVKMNEGKTSAVESDVKEYVYSEVNEGNPVVLQVTQIHSDQGARHLVTVVGYASDVKSASDLTPDKILVLDCVDGKLQTLGQARSEGGHERKLFAQGGKYLAYGPTEKFKESIAT